MTGALIKILRTVLPAPSRRFLRMRHRDFVFRRAMDRFLTNPEAALASDSRVVPDLIYGWGSDWSALDEYLTDCLRYALACNGPILECGSALTTILVGAIAKKRKHALDSMPDKFALVILVNRGLFSVSSVQSVESVIPVTSSRRASLSFPAISVASSADMPM